MAGPKQQQNPQTCQQVATAKTSKLCQTPRKTRQHIWQAKVTCAPLAPFTLPAAWALGHRSERQTQPGLAQD